LGGKKMRIKNFKKLLFFLAPIIFIILCMFYQIKSIPATIYIKEGDKVEGKGLYCFSALNKLPEQNAEVKIFGLLNVKAVKILKVPDIYVIPGGVPIGVKIDTKGLMVIALSEFRTPENKVISPSGAAGIAVGDYIIEVDGSKLKTAEELMSETNNCEGKQITMLIKRGSETITIKVKPEKCEKDGRYKIGLWVRDSITGIGMMTFYDSKTNKFAALGHPITDLDTHDIISVGDGEINKASIISVRKGLKGSPGELKGIFLNEDKPLGKIEKNTNCGIFGEIYTSSELKSKKMKIGLRNEIKLGNAKVLTTIDGDTPKLYDIKIEKLYSQNEPGPKSMVIRITDEDLLNKTGGILQGMSGSPIIQNNKIIGAVTHVLVNKPDTGYGVYIEWMLQNTDSIK
jgi:stage IV sporulation protein B